MIWVAENYHSSQKKSLPGQRIMIHSRTRRNESYRHRRRIGLLSRNHCSVSLSKGALEECRLYCPLGTGVLYMARLPQNMFNRNQRVVFIRSRRRRIRRLRWSLLLVPAVILLVIWSLSKIKIGFNWEELLNDWDIHNKPRFTMLACLGVLIVAVVAIARVLRDHKDKEL